MVLYIMRHGQTQWNKLGKLQGRTNIELTEEGRNLAKKTAEGMEKIHFDFIFSSPLSRAYHTALIVKGNRNTDIIVDERLNEVCFGDYEGRVVDERKGNLALFFDNPDEYVPEGNAESYEDILKRSKEFIDDVLFKLEKDHPNANVLISGHGGINKALLLHLQNKELKDFWKGAYQDNCAVNILEFNSGVVTMIEEAKYYYK